MAVSEMIGWKNAEDQAAGVAAGSGAGWAGEDPSLPPGFD